MKENNVDRMEKSMSYVPEIDGNLRRHMIRVPKVIDEVSGIRIFGKLIKSLVFTTDVPVFCGVGGGTTTGKRVTNLAEDAEFQGATGVVVNAPTKDETIRYLSQKIEIPIVVTVASENTDIGARLEAGASILNVSCANRTAELVQKIRRDFPNVPIIATGGPTDDSILRTIDAGANAITYTPPTSGAIFRELMEKYRITH